MREIAFWISQNLNLLLMIAIGCLILGAINKVLIKPILTILLIALIFIVLILAAQNIGVLAI